MPHDPHRLPGHTPMAEHDGNDHLARPGPEHSGALCNSDRERQSRRRHAARRNLDKPPTSTAVMPKALARSSVITSGAERSAYWTKRMPRTVRSRGVRSGCLIAWPPVTRCRGCHCSRPIPPLLILLRRNRSLRLCRPINHSCPMNGRLSDGCRRACCLIVAIRRPVRG
jgi:hypothetical protein